MFFNRKLRVNLRQKVAWQPCVHGVALVFTLGVVTQMPLNTLVDLINHNLLLGSGVGTRFRLSLP